MTPGNIKNFSGQDFLSQLEKENKLHTEIPQFKKKRVKKNNTRKKKRQEKLNYQRVI